jgi:hypothetical protein
MKSFLCRPILVAVLLVSCASAQKPESKPSASESPRFSSPSDFELLYTRYRFENDGTGRKEVIAKIRILNERGARQRSEESFEYRFLSEDLEIRYFQIRKKDGTLVKVETGQIERPGDLPDGVPRFDYNEKRVRVPGLVPGDLIEYDVVYVIHRPLGPGQFYVAYNFSLGDVTDEQLSVEVPRHRNVKLKTIPGVKFWETGDAIWEVYHWRKIDLETNLVRVTPFVPARTPDVQVSSFANWQEVGRWYAGVQADKRKSTSEIKRKADELTTGLSSDLEKVEALYNFAAKKIRYISLVSLGIGGYEPHSGDETIRNGYGDCKDKVALLAALLESQGLRGSSVLISADRKIDLDIPSPWPFDHVIMMMHLGGQTIWMDPSAAVLPFRMLSYQMRGQQGLVIPPDGEPHFETTPSEAPMPNTWVEEVDGKVGDDGSLQATVTITARGDAELGIRQAFIGPVESVWPFTVQGVVKGIDRRADKVSDVKISGPTDTERPFVLTFRITMPHFLDFSESEAKFKLPLAELHLPPAEEQGVTDAAGWHRLESEPVHLEPPGKRTYKFKLELPSSVSVQLPESVTSEHSWGTYRASYKWNAGSLAAERELVFSKDQLRAQLREEYATFRQKALSDSERVLKVRVASQNTANRSQ